jgi:hypothetical protein
MWSFLASPPVRYFTEGAAASLDLAPAPVPRLSPLEAGAPLPAPLEAPLMHLEYLFEAEAGLFPVRDYLEGLPGIGAEHREKLVDWIIEVSANCQGGAKRDAAENT